MEKCFYCKKNTSDKKLTICPNCGATLCSSCAKKNNKICPYCHSDVETGENYLD